MFPLPPLDISGGAGGAAAPSQSQLNGRAAFDDSNWTVSTGASSASGALSVKTLLIAGGLVLAALVVWKRAAI